jgi:hypothetical protein
VDDGTVYAKVARNIRLGQSLGMCQQERFHFQQSFGLVFSA